MMSKAKTGWLIICVSLVALMGFMWMLGGVEAVVMLVAVVGASACLAGIGVGVYMVFPS